MKQTGCLRWPAMGLLRAELATHLPTRTLHWMGTCCLHWTNISVFGVSRLAVSRLLQETNTEPAAKFSALLVHWVPNYSTGNMTVRITLLFVLLFGRDLATPGHLASIVISSFRVGSFVVVCYLCICFLKYFNFLRCLERFRCTFWLLCSNYPNWCVLTTTNWKLGHAWELELGYTI